MLEVKNLSVHLGDFALRDINIKVEKGEYFVLAGPSGSGKSILLESIAGIYRHQCSGTVHLDGADISHKPLRQRRIGLVFQDNTLFPHLTVRRNIEFSLRLNINNDRDVKSKLSELSGRFLLDDLLHRSVTTLSGGEIQRVLLARTLASDPKIILLDEPLTGVDSLQKDLLKRHLRALHRSGLTILHVTHDFDEAYSLADRMAVMHQGRLLHTAAPEAMLSRPADKFIARFCGHKNFFQAQAFNGERLVLENKIELKLKNDLLRQSLVSTLIDARKINYSKLKPSTGDNIFEGKILDVFRSPLGQELLIDIGIPISVIIDESLSHPSSQQIDKAVWIEIPQEAVKLINRV
ncbi:MAG: ABC transporter ATP-binding protein [Bacteroidales bacterium]|jgi:ABC-type Fe3+/spermidine/putrescine transport system ATPase subunit|nr:ABC transporter ATP-binding protein [Bacteroidales bacterium]MDD3132407.1 ABC transporter ATP-binding protein [Bacteroidales bacterium]MDD4175812.1 ABC transporter ATP-binding protein [Bacteroidales bacterium]MDD4740385.1 ABC transporter ATP-binding protein [Bacteroidales bacterium]